MRHAFAAAALATLAASAPAVAQKPAAEHAEHGNTIVAVAEKAGSFKTLLAAVRAAGLEETLNSAGPFTVFAPTDEAFAKLPAGTVDALLKDIPKLKSVLLYHVASGKVKSGEVVKLTEVKTVQGEKLSVAAKDGVKIGGAKVVKADVMASNGVIHVIDTVLVP